MDIREKVMELYKKLYDINGFVGIDCNSDHIIVVIQDEDELTLSERDRIPSELEGYPIFINRNPNKELY